MSGDGFRDVAVHYLPLPQQQENVTRNVSRSNLVSMTPQRLHEAKKRSQEHHPVNSYKVRNSDEELNPRLLVSRQTPQRRSHTAAATVVAR